VEGIKAFAGTSGDWTGLGEDRNDFRDVAVWSGSTSSWVEVEECVLAGGTGNRDGDGVCGVKGDTGS
jgi:hypothetical protein